MENNDNFHYLQDVFADLFLSWVMPGVIHNFANPLNSIMGRIKILEKRLADLAFILADQHPQAAVAVDEHLKKLLTDVASLNDNANYFRNIFYDLVDKLHNLKENSLNELDLAALSKSELQFANFFLEFKHNVKKTITIGEDIPRISLNKSRLSLCLTMMIIYIMSRLEGFKNKELNLITSAKDARACLSMRFRGTDAEDQNSAVMNRSKLDEKNRFTLDSSEKNLLLALSLLEPDGLIYEFVEENGWSEIRLSLPGAG